AAPGSGGSTVTAFGGGSSPYTRPLRGGSTTGGTGGIGSLGGVTPATGGAASPTGAEAIQAAAARSPEQNVLLYEANRLKNKAAEDAGLRPRLPVHPY